MNATADVTAICERLALGCRPAPVVREADWRQWLANFEEPKDNGRCPECGEPLRARSGKFGPFVGCAGWPGCTFTAALGAEVTRYVRE